MRQVVICSPATGLVEAARLLRDYHVGSLVVVERTGGGARVPVGVVTDRDIVVDGVAEHPDSFTSLTVAQVMTSELVTAREDEDVATVLSRMTSFGIRRVPVVDTQGMLQGILTYDDLVEWMAEQLGGLTRVVRSELKVEQRRFEAEARPAV